MATADHLPEDFRTALGQFVSAVAFLTRLPVGRLKASYDRPDFTTAAWCFPVVGALVGLVGGLVYLVGLSVGLTSLLSAALAVVATILVTGGMHEDGLADTADGFGGGRTAEDKLDIMRDSRIGTFGGIALVLSILLRVAAIDALSWRGKLAVLVVIVAAEAVARTALVRMWRDLPPARPDGLSQETGQPGETPTLVAMIIATVIAVVAVTPAAGFSAAVVAIGGVAALTLAFIRYCRDQIGGQTGDTLGAMEQGALVTFLVLVAAFT